MCNDIIYDERADMLVDDVASLVSDKLAKSQAEER